MAGALYSQHFGEVELRCPCCGRLEMQADFMQKLEWLRVKYGKSFVPNSAFRCPKHNAEVGGEPDSQHLLGRACDIPCTNSSDRYRLVFCALELHLNVIVYETFVHVDNRANPVLLIGKSK